MPSPSGKWTLGKAVSGIELPAKDSQVALLAYNPSLSCGDLDALYEQHRAAASAQGVALTLIADEKCRGQVDSIRVLFAGKAAGRDALGEKGAPEVREKVWQLLECWQDGFECCFQVLTVPVKG